MDYEKELRELEARKAAFDRAAVDACNLGSFLSLEAHKCNEGIIRCKLKLEEERKKPIV